MIRIGQGYDVHRFGEGNRIVLGGVTIDFHAGFVAHSDGDVLIHALCDALLGALALGDIGQHFPDTDPIYANANSRDLLAHVYAIIQGGGYQLVNADMTILAEAPKMMPHIMAMRSHIAADLQCSVDQISVKATTTEKLGFVGKGEGIAAQAVVLLEQSL